MENNHCSIVPYHDPIDDAPDQILMFKDENPCLGLPEYQEISEPSLQNPPFFPSSDGNILDPNDPLSDPYLWGVINDSDGNVAGSFETGYSEINGERIGQENYMNCDIPNCDIPQGSAFGNPIQRSIWPVPPSPYNCSCCQILREIIHTNGKHVSNLEIHGRLGIISHAVLDRYDLDSSTQHHEYQMFDFCKESIDSVKNFLVQYCQDRKQKGYDMLQDPLSIFYEALCVGYNEKEDHDVDSSGFFQSSMVSGSQQDVASSGDAETNVVRLDRRNRQEIHSQNKAESSKAPAKSSLASQRERTGKLKLKDFSEYFHLPINDAAKRMKVCPTVIKKKCRQAGLSRWPHRKIKGIKRRISMKQGSLAAATAEERARAVAEIEVLEQELANIFADLSSC